MFEHSRIIPPGKLRIGRPICNPQRVALNAHEWLRSPCLHGDRIGPLLDHWIGHGHTLSDLRARFNRSVHRVASAQAPLCAHSRRRCRDLSRPKATLPGSLLVASRNNASHAVAGRRSPSPEPELVAGTRAGRRSPEPEPDAGDRARRRSPEPEPDAGIYIRPEVKRLMDERLLRLGIKRSPWATMAIVKWANLTDALKAVK
jgi:hypothetical protein